MMILYVCILTVSYKVRKAKVFSEVSPLWLMGFLSGVSSCFFFLSLYGCTFRVSYLQFLNLNSLGLWLSSVWGCPRSRTFLADLRQCCP